MVLNEVGNTFCNESDVFFDSHVSWMSWNRLSDSICVLYLRYLAIFIIIIIIIIIIITTYYHFIVPLREILFFANKDQENRRGVH